MGPLEWIENKVELSDETGCFKTVLTYNARWVPEPRYHDEQEEFSVEIDREMCLEFFFGLTKVSQICFVATKAMTEYFENDFYHQNQDSIVRR